MSRNQRFVAARPRRRRRRRRRRRHRHRRLLDVTKSSGPTTIEVEDAKPVGGVKDVTYKKGGTVDLTVKSDTADEVHFHGYDVHKDVAKGGSRPLHVPGDDRRASSSSSSRTTSRRSPTSTVEP